MNEKYKASFTFNVIYVYIQFLLQNPFFMTRALLVFRCFSHCILWVLVTILLVYFSVQSKDRRTRN